MPPARTYTYLPISFWALGAGKTGVGEAHEKRGVSAGDWRV